MIHIAIGTKAQFIKMYPVMQRLKEDKIPFNLIDLGQHSLITRELRGEFNIKEPDVYLAKGEDIACLSKAVRWLLRIFMDSLSSAWIRKNLFLDKKGICLIHGDTASTLLGLYLAKRAGLKVAHIEAGLRSFCWLEPFPEELLRVLAMRFSDVLFAPSKWAFDNLAKMGLEKKSILLSGNTGCEAVFFSLSKPPSDLGLEMKDFCLLTVHRIENIFSKRRLVFILEIIEKVSSDTPIVFVQHQPSINQLKKFGLWQRLKKIENVYFFKILSHSQFIHLLNKSRFVITDGGSIQEEAFYLDKPCLLLRHYTERNEGLGENVVLSEFNKEKINYFISHHLEFRRKSMVSKEHSASWVIVNNLRAYA